VRQSLSRMQVSAGAEVDRTIQHICLPAGPQTARSTGHGAASMGSVKVELFPIVFEGNLT